MFDWGLRNPYRFSFDVCTGDRYIGDVGQREWEEIDVADADAGSRNWGWSAMEGNHCFDGQACDPSLYAAPAVEYGHDQGCSVTGGYVYRGHRLPALRGAYLFGDFCSGKIWSFRWADGTASPVEDWSDRIATEDNLSITSFGQDAGGEIYVVNYGGTVYRLDPG